MHRVTSAACARLCRLCTLLLLTSSCVGNFGDGMHDNDTHTTPPPPTTLHRLNRIQYNNTVHDLLGTAQTPADNFSADATADGFDNNADVLSLSSGDLQLMEQAAESLAAEATDPNGKAFASLAPCSTSDTSMCLTRFIDTFGLRAWRRPLTASEVATLTTFATSGAGISFPQQVNRAITVMLSSPYFLYRVELDADPSSSVAHALTSYELATRLSYFVWNSCPDTSLLQAADDGSLLTDGGLQTQLARMLADPHAKSLISDFAGQWLELRNTAIFSPNTQMFPAWDANLRDAMVGQSEAVFGDLLDGTITLDQLFANDHTYLNDQLARLYGLPAVGSSTLTKVSVPPGPRRGLLGQAAVLAATSFPIRTSLVHRGQYVLAQLLCSPPPPAPPNVPALAAGATVTGSQRQRLEAHIANPACASCHTLMDPYGFVLEQFDAIGALRSQDNNISINTSATLPSGQTVADVSALQQVLQNDPRVPQCFVSQLYTYAMGRTPTASDAATVTPLQQTFAQSGQHVDQLLHQIVFSSAFRTRRGGQ